MSVSPESVGPVRVVPVRIQRAIVVATTVAVGASVLGNAFSPYLLTQHPALLLGLAPESHNVVLTTGLLPGWLIVSVTTVRRVLGLLALYGFGWAHGQGAMGFIERRAGRLGKMLRWVERGLSRHGVWVVLVAPAPAVCVMAGVAETRLGRTVAAMSVGQLLWVIAAWKFGDLISALTAPFVEFLSAHVLEATLACVLAVAVWQGWAYLRRRRERRVGLEDAE